MEQPQNPPMPQRRLLNRLAEQGHPAMVRAVAELRAGGQPKRAVWRRLVAGIDAAPGEDEPKGQVAPSYRSFLNFANKLEKQHGTLALAGRATLDLLPGKGASAPISDRELLACEMIKTLLYDVLQAQARSGELPSLDMLKNAASILNTVESAAARAAARAGDGQGEGEGEGDEPQKAEGLTPGTIAALRHHLFGEAEA